MSDEMLVELERALARLGDELDYPRAPGLPAAVMARIADHPPIRRQAARFTGRRALLYPLLAALAILSSILALSPGARSTVASWFHFRGETIEVTRSLPTRLGHDLRLGRRVSLAGAQQQVAYRVLVPSLAGFRTPDEVYLATQQPRGAVSLVYRARPGLPRAATTGTGLLITEIPTRFSLGKAIPPRGAIIEPLEIGGQPGVWLQGAPHLLYYFDRFGTPHPEAGRLAGNALIWQHGTLTIRLEGQIDQQRALAIAESMKPLSAR